MVVRQMVKTRMIEGEYAEFAQRLFVKPPAISGRMTFLSF
ncbi:Uncharacterised protein [uncultured Clostridium sp.]|nr:Uncharacterised protein [uncultured Clostridium sp.]